MTADEGRWFVRDAVDLLRHMRTVHLASASPEASPLASLAPFVCRGGALYVFLSALAGHTVNLRERGEVSLLLARDESDCDDPFARPRLTLWCECTEEARGSAHWNSVLDAMVARLGDTAAVVRELPDFSLFRLLPRSGQVVSGFARAKSLDERALAEVFEAMDSGGGN
jgi:putative heme iron utilization protein